MAKKNVLKYTFEGYSFKTWLFRNKDSLKLIAAGAAGLLAAAVSGLPPQWSAPLGTLVAVSSKLVIDALDYWQSE